MRLILGGIYQGREEYAKSKYGEDITIYRGLHSDVSDLISENTDVEAVIDTIFEKVGKYDVIIAEETFSGLMPIKKDEKMLCEVYGKILEKIAIEAESVERVVCSLGMDLK